MSELLTPCYTASKYQFQVPIHQKRCIQCYICSCWMRSLPVGRVRGGRNMVAMMRRRELEATKNPNHTKEENRYQNAWNRKEMHVPLAVMEEKLESRDKRKREGITFANEKGE